MALLSVSVLLALQLIPVLAVNPTVALGYSTYEGTPYANGITEWLGLRYAAPPTGALRFAAPQDPYTVDGVTVANQVCFRNTKTALVDWSSNRCPYASCSGSRLIDHPLVKLMRRVITSMAPFASRLAHRRLSPRHPKTVSSSMSMLRPMHLSCPNCLSTFTSRAAGSTETPTQTIMGKA